MQKVLVVGATSGLGRGISETLIKRGDMLGIVGRREVLLQEIAASGDDNQVLYSVCDVMCPNESIPVLADLVTRMGGIDRLILCAGVGQQNPSLSFSVEYPTIQTNVLGWTAIVDWIYNLFLAQGNGHLVAISSIAALRGLAPAPAYSASKAYQSHYLEALRQRAFVTKLPIYITDIRPGFVDTPLLKDPTQFFWVIPLQRAVRAIVKAIDKKQDVATITTRWAVMAPLMRWLPNRLLARLISRQ